MRLLLEGPAIEPLLERVRTEHGPQARIVHAERVRTGGVGGFFTREHFEVTVEVDAPAAAPAAQAAPRPVGLDALLAAADAAERHDSDASVPDTAALIAPTAPTTETAAMPAHARDTTPWVFPQVPARATALDAFAPATSTLLVEPDPEPVPAPAVVPVPFAAVPEQRTAPASEQVGGPVPGPHRPMSTESVAFADLLDRLQQENAHPIPLPAHHGDEPGEPLAQAVPAAEVVPAEGAAPRRGRRVARSAPDHLPGRLAALGLPAELLDLVLEGTDGELGAVVARLHLVLADLPVPTADLNRPGAVVLVVGETSQATSAAAAMAARHRLPAEAVVDLGAAGAAPTADHVRRELARLRGGSTAAVVVVGTDAVADPAGDPWLASVAPTLGADQVVACVDATRKVADLARWLGGLERLGLPVGALDVHHVRSTGDPAAVLDLGVPVVGLDGARADAATWAALLVGRLLGEGGAR